MKDRIKKLSQQIRRQINNGKKALFKQRLRYQQERRLSKAQIFTSEAIRNHHLN
jgi:uncharacterized membrane-anchored protein